MKTIPIAALALLVGTSAYAMTPSTQPTGVQVVKEPIATDATMFSATGPGLATQPAAVDWWGTEPAFTPVTTAYAPDEMKAADADVAADEDEADLAADDMALEPAVETLEPVSVETSVLEGDPVPVENGVGGPDAVEMAAADGTPRPAAQNYPACRPGRGDDNCIQLYEAGVQEQLASWNQPTGGFAGAGETQVAMGGPYEPAADSATETERLNQLALADSTRALQTAQLADATALASHEQAFDDSAVESASLAADEMAADDAEMAGV